MRVRSRYLRQTSSIVAWAMSNGTAVKPAVYCSRTQARWRGTGKPRIVSADGVNT